MRRIRPGALPTAHLQASRRFASTGPAKKGTWKGAAARWGVAAGAVYWYCTSPLFADDPAREFLFSNIHCSHRAIENGGTSQLEVEHG